MGDGLVAFVQNVAQIIIGPLGISMVLALVGWGILESISHKRLGPAMWPIIGGAAFYAIPWIITSVMQAR